MGKVFHEVGKQKIEGLAPFDIFLTAVGAESFLYLMPAVQAGLVFSDFSVTHG